MKNATKEEMLQPRKDLRPSPLMTFLAGMKSGTKVFQNFLTKSNLTQILDGMLLVLVENLWNVLIASYHVTYTRTQIVRTPSSYRRTMLSNVGIPSTGVSIRSVYRNSLKVYCAITSCNWRLRCGCRMSWTWTVAISTRHLEVKWLCLRIIVSHAFCHIFECNFIQCVFLMNF